MGFGVGVGAIITSIGLIMILVFLYLKPTKHPVQKPIQATDNGETAKCCRIICHSFDR